ncbi:unnamed protein product [Menidia menidia]|uniref:(Atlantic silverside) hypothetical protein n=1 Tax=Menidia menidia TaxID=238744 RepID=A0A8S4AIZ0_9TELE|nr:unnamed protein product [Menidia menidia]
MDNGTVNYDDFSMSTDGPDEEPCNVYPTPPQLLTQAYVHAAIFVFGLLGNGVVIATYVFYKRAKTMTDVYLVNVAVSDLLFVLALPFIAHNERSAWPMGPAACKALRSAYSVNLYSGMLLLACISGDRYVAIVRARRSFGFRSKTAVYGRLVCLAVWIFSGVLTLPTLLYSELLKEEDLRTPSSFAVSCRLNFDRDDTARLVKLLVPGLQMAVGFLVPLLAMAFCYWRVACTLMRAQNSQRRKAIRVVLAVVLVFVACHLPFNAALLVHTGALFGQRSCAEEKIRVQVLAVSRNVAYLHCCLNPVLYAFIGQKFRSHFLQIMSDLWHFGKKCMYSSSSPRGKSDSCASGLVKTSDGSNNMSSFSA